MNAANLQKIAIAARDKLRREAEEEMEAARETFIRTLSIIIDGELEKAAAAGEFSYEREFNCTDYLLDLAVSYRQKGFLVTDTYRDVPKEGRYQDYKERVTVLVFDWDDHSDADEA